MLKSTRFSGLRYEKVAVNLWRFVDVNAVRNVGPHYKSEKELLADMDRFAEVFGCKEKE